jgi:Holliday junction resolvase-like predicted endonuclease
VTEKNRVGAESEREASATLLTLIRKETARNVFNHISEIEVIALFPDGSMSVEARYRPLKERLMASSDQVRKQRQDTQSLFSANHFAALLECACEHFSDSLGEPFNFIKSCRAYNPLATDLEDHLSTFLEHIKSSTELATFAAPIIASSFFLDNYPPGAHCKFGSNSLFKPR